MLFVVDILLSGNSRILELKLHIEFVFPASLHSDLLVAGGGPPERSPLQGMCVCHRFEQSQAGP
jgi:hypothetical protein